MIIPAGKWGHVHGTQELVKQYEQQYSDGLITKGEKYNKVVDAWQQCSDKVAEEMMQAIQAVQQTKRAGRPLPAAERDLDDGAFRCPRLGGADQAAGRHARPDGQALGRDHREPDHLELQGRPDGARVLQLDARRPQGSGRHRAEDRELGLPDPPSGRRGAGLHHHRRGLRHRAVDHASRPRAAARIWASASWAGPWPRTSSIRAPARCWHRATRCSTRSCAGGSTRSGVDSVQVRSVLTCDSQDRRVRPLLRPRPGARHDRSTSARRWA